MRTKERFRELLISNMRDYADTFSWGGNCVINTAGKLLCTFEGPMRDIVDYSHRNFRRTLFLNKSKNTVETKIVDAAAPNLGWLTLLSVKESSNADEFRDFFNTQKISDRDLTKEVLSCQEFVAFICAQSFVTEFNVQDSREISSVFSLILSDILEIYSERQQAESQHLASCDFSKASSADLMIFSYSGGSAVHIGFFAGYDQHDNPRVCDLWKRHVEDSDRPHPSAISSLREARYSELDCMVRLVSADVVFDKLLSNKLLRKYVTSTASSTVEPAETTSVTNPATTVRVVSGATPSAGTIPTDSVYQAGMWSSRNDPTQSLINCAPTNYSRTTVEKIIADDDEYCPSCCAQQ